jgi:hypothetical protein
MELTLEQSILSLETTNAALVAAVIETKNSIDTRIAAAVLVSTNNAIAPLYVLTANQIQTQTLLINLINKS